MHERILAKREDIFDSCDLGVKVPKPINAQKTYNGSQRRLISSGLNSIGAEESNAPRNTKPTWTVFCQKDNRIREFRLPFSQFQLWHYFQNDCDPCSDNTTTEGWNNELNAHSQEVWEKTRHSLFSNCRRKLLRNPKTLPHRKMNRAGKGWNFRLRKPSEVIQSKQYATPSAVLLSSTEVRENMERECLEQLREFCDTMHFQISPVHIFRFAIYYDFKYEKTRKAIMDKIDQPFMHLKMDKALIRQFETKLLIPLAGLKSKLGSPVFMSKLSRYSGDPEENEIVVKHLLYVLNDLSQSEEDCRNGIVYVADMRNFRAYHNLEGTKQIMDALQGKYIPVRVSLFIMVDPPPLFGRIWKMVRPMLSSSFRRKVRVIKQHKLGDYLMEGYQSYLPSELNEGSLDSSEMIEDYIDMKVYDEQRWELYATCIHCFDPNWGRLSESFKWNRSPSVLLLQFGSPFNSTKVFDWVEELIQESRVRCASSAYLYLDWNDWSHAFHCTARFYAEKR